MKKLPITQQGFEDNPNEADTFPFQLSMRKPQIENEEEDDFEEFFGDQHGHRKKKKEKENDSVNVAHNVRGNPTQSNNKTYNLLASQFYAKPVFTKAAQSQYNIRNNKNDSTPLATRSYNSKNVAQTNDSRFAFTNQTLNTRQPPNQPNQRIHKSENKLGIDEDDMRNNSISKDNNSILKHIRNISASNNQDDYYSSGSFYESDEFSDKHKPTPITFRSEVLLSIVSKLNVKETYPFWYVRISDTVFSEGPKSTNNIIDEYNRNQLNDDSQIRPLDILQPVNKDDNFMVLKDINQISKEFEFFNKYKINCTLIDVKETYDKIQKEMYEAKFFSQDKEPSTNKQNRFNKRRKKNKLNKYKGTISGV